MKEAKWATLLAKLMEYASEIFSSLEGFKRGKLIVEADAEKQTLQIAITKDAGEKLNIDFNLVPKEEKKEEQKEVIKEEEVKTKEPAEEPKPEEKETVEEKPEEKPPEVEIEEVKELLEEGEEEKEEGIFEIF